MNNFNIGDTFYYIEHFDVQKGVVEELSSYEPEIIIYNKETFFKENCCKSLHGLKYMLLNNYVNSDDYSQEYIHLELNKQSDRKPLKNGDCAYVLWCAHMVKVKVKESNEKDDLIYFDGVDNFNISDTINKSLCFNTITDLLNYVLNKQF